MAPTEKASELLQKFTDATFNEGCRINKPAMKQCALIAVELAYKEAYKQGNDIALIRQDYWQEVQAEIEKM
jgi:hypothetical protein